MPVRAKSIKAGNSTCDRLYPALWLGWCTDCITVPLSHPLDGKPSEGGAIPPENVTFCVLTAKHPSTLSSLDKIFCAACFKKRSQNHTLFGVRPVRGGFSGRRPSDTPCEALLWEGPAAPAKWLEKRLSVSESLPVALSSLLANYR